MKISFSKKDIITISIIIFISVISLIFVHNNYSFYKTPIMRIDKIKTIKVEEESNTLGIIEKTYQRKITGTILNVKRKNTKYTVMYEESTSSVVTEKYKVNDKVFIDLDKESIEGLKRDTYVIFMIIFFIISIFLVGKIQGLLSVFSVIINTFIFYYGLNLYLKGINLLFIIVLEMIFFIIFSLTIVSGRNKKTKAAILSSLISLTSLFVMTFIIILITKYRGINFNGISFITVPVEDVFFAEIIVGGLGAIMDVCITMSSSISELIEKDKNISKKSLTKSGLEIGKDIMGTMTNVLFFTYLCSGLPIFTLAIRNGFSVYNYVTTNFSLEITRFLVGSIGIVLSIPIGLFLSIKLLKEGADNE